MKMNKLSIACGAAIAALAGQASAHGPSVTPDLTVFISGASAQQLTIGKVMKGMCQVGTYDEYHDTATSGKDYRAYFCTITGTSTTLDGKKVIVHNRAKGGSVWGVNPVARAESISRMAVDNTGGNCVSTGGVDPSYKCANIVNDIPEGGVSDVEPAMFRGVNVAVGDSELSSTERGFLTPQGQNAVVFGIAMTNNAVAALGTSNLRSAAISSALVPGAYTSWDQMVTGTASGKGIKVCRRVNGSGTQAWANQAFVGFPCSEGALTPSVAGNTVGTLTGDYQVIENATSGGVKSCLNDQASKGNFAIGLLSLESIPGGTDNWQHASIDGIAASAVNAANGTYPYWVEQSFQYRNTDVCTGGASVHVPPCLGGETLQASNSADQQLFLDTFFVRSGDPAFLAGAVPPLPGVASLPTLWDPTSYPAGQVMTGTNFANTCQVPTLFY